MAASPIAANFSQKTKEALAWTSPLLVSIEKSEQQQMVENLFAQITSSPERRAFLDRESQIEELQLPPPKLPVEGSPLPASNRNERDYLGRTALHRAAEDDGPETIRAFIEAGADLNIQDRYGRTALHVALFSGGVEAARALIAAGINLNIQDNDGKIALDYALLHNNLEAICAFIQADPQTHIPKDLRGALFRSALQRGCLSTVWQLLPVSKFQIAMVAIGGSLCLLTALIQLYPSTEENSQGEL